MATFNNDIFGFSVIYGPQLDKILPDDISSFRFVPSSDPWRAADVEQSPFASNPHASDRQIVYNQQFISKIDLTSQEIFACIAHEIGHYIKYSEIESSDYEGVAKEIICDSVATQLGLQYYLASALVKMSDVIPEADLSIRLSELSKHITLFRPEWTCGRYIAEKHAALYYNLIEGMSYSFEGLSADVAGLCFSRKRNGQMKISEISQCGNLTLSMLLGFISQLVSKGLLSPTEITRDQIDSYRERISSERKSHSQLPSNINERLPVEHSSAESDFTNMVGGVTSVMFELTYLCSEKCVHCYNIGATRNDDEVSHRGDLIELDLNDYKRIIDELYEQGLFKVCLSGGDPFSKKEVWDIIEYLYERDIAFDVYTNGQRLQGKEEKLANMYPRTVAVSIYSADANIHNRITRTTGSLQRSLSVMRELSKYAVPLNLKCCVMRPNLDSYKSVLSVADEVGAVPQFEISITDSVDGDQCARHYLRLTEDELNMVLCDDIIPMQVGPLVPNFGKVVRLMEENACGAGYHSFCITPDGKLIPCCAFHLEVGDLTKESLSKILSSSVSLKQWQSSTLSLYTECMKKDYCPFCALCPGLNYSENGDYRIPGENNCYVAKVRWKKAEYLKEGNVSNENIEITKKEKVENFSYSKLHRIMKKRIV